MPGVVSSPFPPSRPASPALCVAGRPVRVSLDFARWYATPCGLCVPRARSGCPSGSPRVSFVCVCARALAVSAPPRPPRAGVARAPRAVPVLGAGRAVPRGPCPSACPVSVLCPVWLAWGGSARSRFPPTWLGAVRSPWGVSARLSRSNAGGWGEGGAACAPSPPLAWPGAPVGRGVVLPQSVPLPSLGRQQIGCRWRRSGHGGRGAHTALVRACLLSPGTVRVASLCAGAGSLVHRGSRGGRRLGALRRPLLRPPPPPPGRRGPSRGTGNRPLSFWEGWGAGAPVACGSAGRNGGTGGGGGLRRGSPPPSPEPPLSPVRVRPGLWGSPGRRARPAAGGSAWRGGGGGGGLCAAPPRRSGQGA